MVRRLWGRLERFAASPIKLLVVDVMLALAVALMAAGFFFYSAQTHTTLCTFKGQLEDTYTQRVKAYNVTVRFMKTHAGAFGLTPKEVTAALADQRADIRSRRETIDSLGNLNC